MHGLLRGLWNCRGRGPPPMNRTIILLLNSLLDTPVNRLVQITVLVKPGDLRGARPGDGLGAWSRESPVAQPGARTGRFMGSVAWCTPR